MICPLTHLPSQFRKTLLIIDAGLGGRKKNYSSFVSNAFYMLWNLSVGSPLILRKTLWCEDCTHSAYQRHRKMQYHEFTPS